MAAVNATAIRRWLLSTAMNEVALPTATVVAGQTESTSSSPSNKDRSALGRSGFVLSLREIHGFTMPEEIRKLSNVTVYVQLTFFDFETRSFFGNTYKSGPVPSPASDLDGDDAWPVEKLVYFTTARKSPKCVGVLEVVASSFNHDTAKEMQYSLGWAVLPLFSSHGAVDIDTIEDHGDVDEDDIESCRLYAGTPRALMFFPANEWKKKVSAMNKGQRKSSRVFFSLHTSIELMDAKHLVPPDFAFGPNTPVPGLEPVLLPNAVRLTPALASRSRKRPWSKPPPVKLDVPLDLDLSGFNLHMPRGMDSAARDQIARMRSSFSGSSVGAGDLRLIMRVAVHNGVCLTVPEEAANLRMSGSRLRGSQENSGDPRWVEVELHESNNDVFRASVRKRIPHYFKDERCALVFEIVYTSESSTSRRPALRDYDDYEGRGRQGVLSSRSSGLHADEYVVATGVFLPYNGEGFASDVNDNSNRYGGSRDGILIPLARGALFSPNGFVPASLNPRGVSANLSMGVENGGDEDDYFAGSRRGAREATDVLTRGPDALYIRVQMTVTETQVNRERRRKLEVMYDRKQRQRQRLLEESREMQSRGETSKPRKSRRLDEEDDYDDEQEDDYDDDDDEKEESDDDFKKSERSRLNRDEGRTRKSHEDKYNRSRFNDNIDRDKESKRSATRSRDVENRSFFPDGRIKGADQGGAKALGSSLGGAGSNDPLVRSLLAQSLKQPLRQRNSSNQDGTVAVSAMPGNYKPGSTAVISSATPLATELTRASRTFLSQRGFTDVLSDSVAPQALAASKRMPLPAPRRINMDLEFKDKLGANEITFQFAAFRVLEGTNASRPKSVYFTYQFFNSLPTRTERMRLAGNAGRSNRRRRDTDSAYGADSNSYLRKRPNGSLSEPFVLVRESTSRGRRSSSSEVPSLAIKYTVDTTLVPGESRLFTEYLAYKTLYIDVWNGDSLMQMGTVAIDLRQLLRQGEPFVKNALEYDVIGTPETSDPSSIDSKTAYARALPAGNMVGRLQILTSNYGLAGKGPYDERSERNAALSGRAPGTPSGDVGSLSSSTHDWRIGAPPSTADPVLGAKHRVRAKPLTASNPELRALITSRHKAFDLGETRAVQREKKRQWSRDVGGNDVRALSDANSISTMELSKLIDFYRGSRPNTIRWKDFVRDFGGTVTTSSKSRDHQVGANSNADPLERQLRKILSAAQKRGMNIEESFEHFDEDKTGRVNRSQFRRALADLGFKARDRDMDSLMERLDMNGDGEIVSLCPQIKFSWIQFHHLCFKF